MDSGSITETDTYESWTARVKRELGDRELSSLNWTGPTGLEFQAYYPIAPSVKKFPVIHSRVKNEWDEGGNWDVFEYIRVNDPKEANKQALDALLNGANGLLFLWPDPKPEEMKILLDGINLTYIRLGMEIPSGKWPVCAQAVRDVIEKASYSTNLCQGFFQCDFSECENGEKWAEELIALTNSINDLQDILPAFRFNPLNMAFLGNAGVTSDWEIALGLAVYDFQLETAKINIEQHTHITLSVGGDYFSELAKFRIAPYLFRLIAEKHSIRENEYVLAVMNQTYMSHLDTYTNILRLGTSAMSAVIGGCNGLVLVPFSRDNRENPDFVRRVSRNIQLVLLHESGIAGVQDPAAGSAYIEELSFRLSGQVWADFLHIQNNGGLISFLKSGMLDEMIIRTKARIIEEVQSGKRFFLGVNRYPNPKESGWAPEEKGGVFAPLTASSAVSDTKKKEVSNG